MTLPAALPFRLFTAVVLSGLVLLHAGCATMFTPNSLEYQASSTPAGAQIFIDNVPMGVTPAKMRLDPDRQRLIRFEAPGYQPHEELLAPQVNVVTFLNIFVYIIPIVIDIASGNFYDARDIHANLVPSGGPRPPVAVAPPPRPSQPRPRPGAQVIAEEYAPIVPGPGFQRVRAAVLPLRPSRNASEDDAATISTLLEPEISSQGRHLYELVDRTEVEQTISELGFQQSDYSNRQETERIGEMLGVQHLIAGTFAQSGDGSLNTISLKVIQVSTGRVLASEAGTLGVVADAPAVLPGLVNELLLTMVEKAEQP